MSAPETETPATETVPTEAPTAPQEPATAPGEGTETGTDTGDGETGEEDGEGDGDTGEGEEAPEQQEQEPSSEALIAAMDKRATQLQRRGENYAQAVVEYVQETEQPLLRCGFCLDALPGFLPSPAVQPFTPDQLSFARSILGMPDEPPYVQANDAHVCSGCDGWGQVLTGSRRNDQKTRKCFKCNGLGWEGAGAGDVQQTNGSSHVHVIERPEQAPQDAQRYDPWGRPAGHPGYGILPTPGLEQHLLPPGMSSVQPIS